MLKMKKLNYHCRAVAKSGKPCAAAATAGGLCFFHSNPTKASELGRIGGRAKRFVGVEQADPLPRLDSANAIRDTLARLIEDTYQGKLHPRIAAGLAPLISLQLRALSTSDLHQRLARIEARYANPEFQDNTADAAVKAGHFVEDTPSDT